MEANNMRRVERNIKHLAEHMDNYTYEGFREATQAILDDARDTISDEYYCECTVGHLRNLLSLYRFLKMGQYE